MEQLTDLIKSGDTLANSNIPHNIHQSLERDLKNYYAIRGRLHMAILVEYRGGAKITATCLYARQTPSPAYTCEDGKTFWIGDVFDTSFEKINESPWTENPDLLNSFEGNKAGVRAEAHKCVFAVDMHGIDTFYYYHQEDHFILSDNFWDIVRVVRPSYADLNVHRIRESLLTSSISGETLIQNLYILRPCHFGVYDATEQSLRIERYRALQYTGEVTDVQEAMERMDAILHHTMELIKEKCGDVTYGVGISGGLDSRIIPHYAKAHGMRVTGFNFCIPKPHGLFLAQSVKNAQAVADVMNVPYQNVKYNPDTIEEKLRLVVKNSPTTRGRSAFKFEREHLPDFDVLLTGGSGMIVGSELPTDILTASEEDLARAMFHEFLPNNSATFSLRVKRALSYIFRSKRLGALVERSRRIGNPLLDAVLTNGEVEEIKQVIQNFVREGRQAKKSNLEIYEDYFINVCGYTNRQGSFESFMGQKRSFSIYIPFMFQETLRWAPQLLFDRKVLNELIIQKVPESAAIKNESFGTSPSQREAGFTGKLIPLVQYLIRGNGTAIDQHIMRKPSVTKKLLQELNEDRDSWFHRVFGLTGKKLTRGQLTGASMQTACSLWEIKRVIDCLETQAYDDFE